MRTVMNLVAPSPSRTMACANHCATSISVCLRSWAASVLQAVTKLLPAWPVAMTTKESLVEVSPSMVMRLKEASANSLARAFMSEASMAASVAMKPSMVAMLGRIMPAPLEMPVTVMVFPSICTCRLTALGKVSVVMMACEAKDQLSVCAAAMACGKPSMMR